MSRVVAIGESTRVAGFLLVGVDVMPADSPTAVLAAWRALPPDTGLVVLSPAAAAVVAELDEKADRPLTAVMPP